MKKSVLCVLCLSISLACLAVVRPPLVHRLFSRYHTYYRSPRRNYGSTTEQLSAIKESQKNIASEIADQNTLIKNLQQWKTELNDVTLFKNLRQKNVDRKLQAARRTLKELKEKQDAGYRSLYLTSEKLNTEEFTRMINAFRNK